MSNLDDILKKYGGKIKIHKAHITPTEEEAKASITFSIPTRLALEYHRLYGQGKTTKYDTLGLWNETNMREYLEELNNNKKTKHYETIKTALEQLTGDVKLELEAIRKERAYFKAEQILH